MQARGMAYVSAHRASGLIAAVALAAGVLIGGQVDVTGALRNPSAAHHDAAPSQAGTTPLFIIGDADGVFHQQQAAASAAASCGGNSSALFIGGDSDGLANPALNAAIPTSNCDVARH
jgi:hypothetical protein